MNSKELQQRSKQFALAIINIAEHLPNNRVGWTFTDQIVRSSTSVTANCRAVCRTKSDKDFISKMGIVIEEADETLFWLEIIEEIYLIEDLGIDDCRLQNKNSNNQKPSIKNHKSEIRNQKSKIVNLKKEANELVSIFAASVKTVKNHINQKS